MIGKEGMNCSNINLRRSVALWFLLLYILVGVPLWYKITTIYRAPLPEKYIKDLKDQPNYDINMVIPVYIKSNSYKFPDLHDAVQLQVNHLLNSIDKKVNWALHVLPYPEDNSISPENNYIVHLVSDDILSFSAPYNSREGTVFHDDQSVLENNIPFYIAQVFIDHIFLLERTRLNKNYNPSSHVAGIKNLAIDYNPDVHLSISLLSGDGNPVSWDVETVANKYLAPLREFLSPLVNFTVDTDIVYFNDLHLHQLKDRESLTWNDLAHTMDLSELSSGNYYNEQSSLHLSIVFPSHSTGELKFINSTKHWQSYLVPQWGTIIINDKPLPPNAHVTSNYLTPIMHKFARELFLLLGITDGSEVLNSPIVIMDSFKRLTILNNLEKSVETLWSLVKMTSHLPQMTIPKEVAQNVHEALELRLQIVEMLNNPIKQDPVAVWDDALAKSNRLFYLCEKAFFHKEMVQQNFLPQEHKIAVYLPLLGPITIVTIAGFFKSMKEKELPEKEKEETE
ncbi:HFL216Cp [Eremothecium sinecaudum]|uniref:HFL216Cp n=1 Tax=Eremothecium sinecaudum TaxID=45286 RepID=A0A0X8HUD6_9SACH|nr:HFL216Cp [Eremothecium sinecaudum]AMD21640.1 HFL216Cp [Eremothecium sinecaudum]